jgi:hypothetical protein
VLRREGDAAAQYGLGFRSVDLAAPVRHPITGENVPLKGVAQGKHILAGQPRALQISTAYPEVTRPDETLDPALRARERRDFQSGLPGAAALHRG